MIAVPVTDPWELALPPNVRLLLEDAEQDRVAIVETGGKKAAEWKLVNEAVPLAKLKERTVQLAEVLLKKNPVTLKAAKDAGYDVIYAQAEETRPTGTIPRTFISKFDGDRIFKSLLQGKFDRWEEWV